MQHRFSLLAIAATAYCVLIAPLFASACGNIRGSIKDPFGAAVDRATVQIANREQSDKRSVLSAPDGAFDFPELSCGWWSLTVEADGFRRAFVEPLYVQVGQTVRADVTLVIGSRFESVEVRSEAPAIADDNPTLGNVIENRVVSEMPLNARQYLDLALLSPGLVPAAPGTQGSGFNSAGIRSQSNVYLLDGISNIDTQTNQPLNLFRITEAVEEFDVETGPRQAQSGRGAGAQVNVVTKSGTGAVHGSLFEYLRNTALNASDFFTNKLGGRKGALNRNQFGGSAGGPVIKHKTFFFASWEDFQQVSHVVSSTLVPTLAQRASVTDPVSQRLLSYWPLPNAAGTLNYISNVANLDSDNTGLLKLDHHLSERDQVTARWTEYWGQSTAAGVTALTGGNQGPISQVSAMLDEIHEFSPLFINDFRAGYTRYVVTRLPQDSGLNAATIFTDSAGVPLPGVVDAIHDPLNSGLPAIAIGGGFASLGTNANFPQSRTSNTTELFNDSSLVHAVGGLRQTIRWGFYVRREDLSRYLDRAERGTISFSSLADFAKGQINTSTFRTGSTQAYWRRYPWAAYVQDNIRIRETLTVTIGLRYEYPSSVAELRHHAVNFAAGYGPMIAGTGQILDIDPSKTGPASFLYRTAPFTLPASGVFADKNNFASMAGFAWTPRFFGSSNQTAIRGGVRVAYDDLFNNVPSTMALNAPYNLQTTQTANVTQPGKFGWATAFDQRVPLVSNYGQQGPGTPATGVLTFQGADPNLRSAYAYVYDFGFQRGVGKAVLLEAEYVGSSGHRLGIYTDLNQPFVIIRDVTKRGPVAPNEQVFPYNHFGQVQLARSIGNSNYNGLAATAKYRAARLILQASYTAGKSLDYNSSYFGSGNLPGETGAPIDSRNLRLEHGPSAFDVRHRLVLLTVIDLPAPRWQSGIGRAVFPGWQLSGIVTFQTGIPFTVVNSGPDASGFNQAISGISPQGGNRPNLIKTAPLPQNNGNPDAAFDPTWFSPNAAGQDGTSGRNQYYGPGLVNVDFSIVRTFRLFSGEDRRLQFRTDFFNLLNHTNFANPVADMNNASFGKITQTLGSAVATAAGTSGGTTGGPRIVQFSLRLRF
ncbi:MAG: carboxypeptidase regulatory-like domain-containing protein [Acidobacteriia bacterium]|nr:carboxypeptidase regulatory-like domain-containing protein [Terriglobia bacterium]